VNDRYQSGSMKAISDNMRCIDLLQSLKEVDPGRIGVIGHSLGGHGAIFAGAFDTRLKVTVSSSGWTLFHNYMGGKLAPWAQDVYMPLMRDKYNLDPDKIPFDFDEVIASIAPRAFFSNSPLKDGNFDVEGVRKGIANAAGVYDFLKAGKRIQVRYPDSGHSFPHDTRLEAYRFIDKILKHKPEEQELEADR